MASIESGRGAPVLPLEGESPSNNPSAETLKALRAKRQKIDDALTFSVDQDPAMMRELDEVDEEIKALEQKATAKKTIDTPSATSAETLPEADQSPDATPPDPVTLEQIQAAEKYAAIREQTTIPEEIKYLRERAEFLGHALLGKDSSPEIIAIRGSVADFGTAAALAASRRQQEHGKKLIPERFYEDQGLQREMFLMSERIKAGEGIDVLLKEAYDAGKTDMRQLRALKMIGTLIIQKNAPDGERSKWEAASEQQRRLVRFGEIINTGVLMNTALLRLKRGDLPPDVAAYVRQNLMGFGQNQDIPNFIKKDLQKITARLEEYETTKGAAGEKRDEPDPESVLSNTGEQGTTETVVGEAAPTVIKGVPMAEAALTTKPSSTEDIPDTPTTAIVKVPYRQTTAELSQELKRIYYKADKVWEGKPSGSRTAMEVVRRLLTDESNATAPLQDWLLQTAQQEGIQSDVARERRRQRYIDIFDNERSFFRKLEGGWLDRLIGERLERYYARVTVATNPGRFLPIFSKESWRQVMEARQDTSISLYAAAAKIAPSDQYRAALLEQLADQLAVFNAIDGLRYHQPAWQRFFGIPIEPIDYLEPPPEPQSPRETTVIPSPEPEKSPPSVPSVPTASPEPPPESAVPVSNESSTDSNSFATMLGEAVDEARKIDPYLARRWAEQHESEINREEKPNKKRRKLSR